MLCAAFALSAVDEAISSRQDVRWWGSAILALGICAMLYGAFALLTVERAIPSKLGGVNSGEPLKLRRVDGSIRRNGKKVLLCILRGGWGSAHAREGRGAQGERKAVSWWGSSNACATGLRERLLTLRDRTAGCASRGRHHAWHRARRWFPFCRKTFYRGKPPVLP